MFVCLSVGMWRANGNPNPCSDLDEILHAHPRLSKEGFDAGLIPHPLLPGNGGLKHLELKDRFLKTVNLQNKR